MSYEAYVLTKESRDKLASIFPPKHLRAIGHHVTHRFGVARCPNIPYGEQTHGWFEVVGYVEAPGIEALVVAVTGKTERPDGKVYHVTWSLDPDQGRKPAHSNDVIAQNGWTPLAQPIQFDAVLDYIA